MCGIVGYLNGANRESSVDRESNLRVMADRLRLRGPDSGGYWVDADACIGFAHRRLAIVDLSAAGHQPMHSASGRFVITFNGEIYNVGDLRKRLEAEGRKFVWQGHSDTEVLLACFDAWGIEGTLRATLGMFAMGVWDRELRSLTLARDRLGEKPLYYGWQGVGEGAAFVFASELKALVAHPQSLARVDRGALALLMRHNYVPAPYSIYEGIQKLPAGCMLTVSLRNREPEISSFWSLIEVIEHRRKRAYQGSPQESVSHLETLLRDAVSRQCVADVPLGAFLSGGIDSSTVVALMQTHSSQRVRTFTIGFDESEFNEAHHAKDVAKHLGTAHTELYVTADDALAVIPRLPELYCEPFSDSSQVPTYLVSKLARSQVTVSLSGDGGDELFCGYNRYAMTHDLWSRLARVPRPIRHVITSCLHSLSPDAWSVLMRPFRDIVPSSLQHTNVGDRIHKIADVLTSSSIDDLYLRLVSHWKRPTDIVLNASEPPTLLTGNAPQLRGLGSIERMMALDTISYLSDDILVKVDRAAMGVSLETRVPYLDHRVVEFAWSLPLNYKLRDGQSKWPLRQILYKYVPREIVERPKVGFGIPIDRWLRGPLREWAEELLDESRLRREGYFDAVVVSKKWREHLSGRRNWQYLLWDVLMFQAWLEQQAN